MRRSAAVLMVFVVVIAGAAVTLPAHAGGSAPDALHLAVVRSDGNDTASPLDLKQVRLVHAGPRTDLLTFSTWNPVTNTELDPIHHGNFGVGIDLNNQPRRYEYIIYISVQRGRLSGVVLNTGTHRVSRTTATRLGPGLFRIRIPLGLIGSPHDYRFFVFGFYKAAPCSAAHPCSDVVPNRFPLLLQDLAAPTITADAAPVLLSTDASADLTYPFELRVTDDTLGSGVRHWALQDQPVGAADWTNVMSGTSTTATEVPIAGSEGAAFNVRILAYDRAGNVGLLTRQLVFPFDDQNPDVATYVGTWTQASNSSTSYLGTTSASSTPGDSATFTFTGGHRVCPLGMPSAVGAQADVTLDFGPAGRFTEGPASVDRGRFACLLLTGDATTVHTLTLTIFTSTGDFVIDGVAIQP